MKNHEAWTLAKRVVGEIAPMADRIEIAGSIRRCRPEVNDIDLVVQPKPGQLQAIKARCRLRSRVIRDGDQNFIVGLRLGPGVEFQLDIFFARPPERDLVSSRPGNFGSLLLCRTGSREHNIYLCQAARARDMKWQPYAGVYAGGTWVGDDYTGGKLIASETEEDIFAALGIPFVMPATREVGAPVPSVGAPAGAAP